MSTALRIALVGAAGRMGVAITRAVQARDDCTLSAAVERPGAPSIGADLGQLSGVGPIGVELSDDLGAIGRGDVVVDLSLPEATADVIAAARAARLPLVCGTTGLDARLQAQFKSVAAEIAVLVTANLSPGIALLTAFAEQAREALGADYDIEIVEMHHRNKVDAPSGTALALAQAVAPSQAEERYSTVFGRRGRVGQRRVAEVGVHAVRGGGVFGEHTVIFAGEHERVELTHRASSRELFALGALKAARFLYQRPAGLYTMKQVLGLA